MIQFDHSYARDLPGAYVAWRPAQAPAPQMLFLNRALAEELRFQLGDQLALHAIGGPQRQLVGR